MSDTPTTGSLVSSSSYTQSFGESYYGDQNLFSDLTPDLARRGLYRTGVAFSFPHHMHIAATGGDGEAVMILATIYVRYMIGDLSELTSDPPMIVGELCSFEDGAVSYRGVSYPRTFTQVWGNAAPAALFHAALELIFRICLSPGMRLTLLTQVAIRTRVDSEWLSPFANIASVFSQRPMWGGEILYELLSVVFHSRPRELLRVPGCTDKLTVLLVRVVRALYPDSWLDSAPTDLIVLIDGVIV